jgi:hypothetical protein
VPLMMAPECPRKLQHTDLSLFFLDGEGRIADVAFSDRADDADAIDWAERRLRQNPEFQLVEIWAESVGSSIEGRCRQRAAAIRTLQP